MRTAGEVIPEYSSAAIRFGVVVLGYHVWAIARQAGSVVVPRCRAARGIDGLDTPAHCIVPILGHHGQAGAAVVGNIEESS